jgi:hypothetical protein
MKKLTIYTCMFLFVLAWGTTSAIEVSTTDISAFPAREMTVGDMLSMKAKDFAAMSGEKFSLKEKLAYGMAKSQLKRAVKKGKVSLEAPVAPALAVAQSDFNMGAFFLGLLLGLIGVLIVAIAFNDRGAWKWALFGWGIWVLILVLLIL